MAAVVEARMTQPFEDMRLIDLVNFVKIAYATGCEDSDFVLVNMDHPDKKVEMPYGLEIFATIEGSNLLDFDRIEI
jgi:hypothetical protein